MRGSDGTLEENTNICANVSSPRPALRRIARRLVVHYRADDLQAIGIPDDRVKEINTRYAERMLHRLMELDDRPLTAERPQDAAIVGCCRDNTVLLLSLLRHQGVPARGRIGFASYFETGWYLDHEVAEVWDAQDNRRRLVDANLDEGHVDRTDGTAFHVLELLRSRCAHDRRHRGSLLLTTTVMHSHLIR